MTVCIIFGAQFESPAYSVIDFQAVLNEMSIILQGIFVGREHRMQTVMGPTKSHSQRGTKLTRPVLGPDHGRPEGQMRNYDVTDLYIQLSHVIQFISPRCSEINPLKAMGDAVFLSIELCYKMRQKTEICVNVGQVTFSTFSSYKALNMSCHNCGR